jgi:mersacidin/lichenicidin family type 2 lantibiotic
MTTEGGEAAGHVLSPTLFNSVSGQLRSSPQPHQKEKIVMSHRKIIRAWKDEDYRLSLSEAERALLPEHPAGALELTDAQLEGAAGGLEYISQYCTLFRTCSIGQWVCQ